MKYFVSVAGHDSAKRDLIWFSTFPYLTKSVVLVLVV